MFEGSLSCFRSFLLKAFNHDNQCVVLVNAERVTNENDVPLAPAGDVSQGTSCGIDNSAQTLTRSDFIPKFHLGKKDTFAWSWMIQL